MYNYKLQSVQNSRKAVICTEHESKETGANIYYTNQFNFEINPAVNVIIQKVNFLHFNLA